jgi:hypothetical protein
MRYKKKKNKKKASISIFTLCAFFLFALFFSSCKDKVIPPVEVGYEYFPVEVGHWIEYEVDSIVYDDFTGTIDTSHYFIKEVFESEFIDNQNRPTVRMERYFKAADTLNYNLKDIWYVNLTNSTAEKVEENYRITKLAFPINFLQSWDKNAFNVNDEIIYEYDDIHETKTINTLSFDSTITAQHYDQVTLISEDYEFEIYAKNVGMIKKKFVHLEKVWDNPSQVWVIESGVILEYKIIDYKNN